MKPTRISSEFHLREKSFATLFDKKTIDQVFFCPFRSSREQPLACRSNTFLATELGKCPLSHCMLRIAAHQVAQPAAASQICTRSSCARLTSVNFASEGGSSMWFDFIDFRWQKPILAIIKSTPSLITPS